MTPEERDRLTRLETKVEGIDDWLRSISEDLGEIKKAANMGKGAWWLLLRIGGLFVLIVGAAGWVFDKIHK